MSFHVAERDTTAHENMPGWVCCLEARRSEVLGLNGAYKPSHEFDPGHRFGTTDCDPLRRSTRGRNCFFRRPDRRDLDHNSHQVEAHHVRAALALLAYSEASVSEIFGDRLGDADAEKILEALKRRPIASAAPPHILSRRTAVRGPNDAPNRARASVPRSLAPAP